MLDLLEIARLEEGRQAAGVAEVADEAEALGGGTMCFGGKGSWCNQASGQGLDGPVEDAGVDRLVDFYVQRGAEPKVELCPFADGGFVEGLSRRGFTIREFENVFVRELGVEGPPDGGLGGAWPAGLRFERVEDPGGELAGVFEGLFAGVFAPPAGADGEAQARTVRRMIEHPLCEVTVAFVDGRAAGAGVLEVRGGVAALFGGAVLEGFRRRGIQQALMSHRLRRAREAGAVLACIHSRPGISTERNALRLGFIPAYSKAIVTMRGEGLVPSP